VRVAKRGISFFIKPPSRFALRQFAEASSIVSKSIVGFVPLPYQPENNDIPVKTPPTSFDALRTLAG
jgi:hypothetical protein